jgi:N-acetylmuramoyl-L-alanine amidase
LKNNRITPAFSVLSIFLLSALLFPDALFAAKTLKDSSSPDALYSKAMSSYKSLHASQKKKKYRHYWQKTISQFEIVYNKFPESSKAPRALFMMGKLYYGLYGYSQRKDDLLQAINEYRRVTTHYPKSNLADDAQLSVGEIYEKKLKNRTRAYQEYQKVVLDFPKGDMSKKAKDALQRLQAYKQVSKTTDKINNTKPKSITKAANVNGIRFWTNPDYTRIVVTLDKATNFEHHMLKKDPSNNKPPRLYVDFFNAKLSPELVEPVPIKDGLLERIRTGQYQHDKVRVVIDMHSIVVYNIFSLNDPYRLVLDIMGEGSVVKNKHPDQDISTNPSGRSPTLAQQFDLGVKRIVIDPGHGGKDPGAIGKRGLKEKEVVLKIAKKLGKKLEQELGMQAILTRNSDTFIPLEERTALANTRGADLFVSIHANASQRRRASGVETYYLNLSTDEESMRVAARENATSRKRMSDLQLILNDLLQTAKLNESSRLAAFVQKDISSQLRKIHSDTKNLGVKQAPFYVLIGAQMPSILVEVSFISNPTEEKRLQDDKYLDGIVNGIMDGLRKYIDSMKVVAYK